MSYSVKYSTTNAQKELSPLDKSLRSIENTASLQTICKLCRNVFSKPDDPKFRRLRLSNEKIHALLVAVPGCLEALGELGWSADKTDSDFLEHVGKVSFDKVRTIENAIDYRTKEDEKAKVRMIRNRNKAAREEGKRE